MSGYENEADYNHDLNMRAEAEHSEYLHQLELEEKSVTGWSVSQKEAIRATLTFLCQEAYEAGHSARQKDRVVTGSDVDRRIETVLSEIEAITKGEEQ
jgi:hypothetical protein